jgi:hypothetical protein
VLMPFAAAYAAPCSNVPSWASSTCVSGQCDSNYQPVVNLIGYFGDSIIASSCGTGGQTCCIQLTQQLCSQAASRYMPGTPGTCKSACADQNKLLTRLMNQNASLDLCPGTQVCCAEEAQASGPGGSCLKLEGVTATCKGAPGSGEVSANAESWTDWIKDGSCTGQVCVVKQETALCKAMAKTGVSAETADFYACAAKQSDCESGTLLTQTISRASKACPSGQWCCISKQAKASSSGKTPAGSPKTLPDPLGGASIHSIIGNVIRTFAGVAGSIALIMFVYGGIMMIMSGGESGKVESARKILINSAIGIVLIFAAYTFVAAIIDAILAE